MTIRFANDQDWNRIIAIYNQAVVTGKSTAHLKPVLLERSLPWLKHHSKDRHPIYVAESDNTVIGWCSLSPYRPGREALKFTAEISYYVDYTHHRQGVATQLIKYAMQDCHRLGIKTLFGILLDINHASERLLTKLGFERWGYLPDVASINGKECGHLYLGKRLS